MKCLVCCKGTLVFEKTVGDEVNGYMDKHICDECGEEEYLNESAPNWVKAESRSIGEEFYDTW